jgi:excinuclease ABC subunit A
MKRRDESGIGLDARAYSTRRACPSCGTSFPEPDPRMFSCNSKHGWCPQCYGTGLKLQGFDEQQTGEEVWWNAWREGEEMPCPACDGQRLNRTALAVQWQGRSIAQLAAGSVREARRLFGALKLDGRDGEIARDVLAEIRARLDFLEQVGLGYLALDRAAPTLSGSEAQRIKLVTELAKAASSVTIPAASAGIHSTQLAKVRMDEGLIRTGRAYKPLQTLYVLDEPTVGLSMHDVEKLLCVLHRLVDAGNTVVVIEHNLDVIAEADWVIDLGPEGGDGGGRVVAQCAPQELVGRSTHTGEALRAFGAGRA